jgi:16S rRNA (adenine1518-N6/adenine1519-N6)-dimethyltransferase
MTHSPLKPLKRFGQNFLIDPNIKRKIVAAVHPETGDHILEIGPGDGALTFELARAAGRVYAVEIDKKRCARLSSQAADIPRITLVCADVLKFDLGKFLLREGVDRVRVVSNLPYYITTPVIEYLFERINLIEDIFLTVQKEVAQRLVARPGDPSYGSLSCFVDYYCEADVVFAIAPACFRPKPKVDSAFVHFRPRRDRMERLHLGSEEGFFRVIRTSFGQRRKTLRASLARMLGRAFLEQLGADELLERRPQTVSVQEFAGLSNRIFESARP